MIDRNKLINWFEHLLNAAKGNYQDFVDLTVDGGDDILALLKEQETEDTGRCRIFQCKKCGFGIDDIFVTEEEKYQIVPRYCPNCGRSVKLG